MNPQIVIPSVTSAQFDALKTELAADKQTTVHYNASVDTYTVVGHGVNADVTYAQDTIRVHVKTKPWLVTIGEIRSKLVAAMPSAAPPAAVKA